MWVGGEVDAQFIQSAARVGDYVEIALVSGSGYEGLLSELTLSYLALQLPDGRKVSVTLPTVAAVVVKNAVPEPEPVRKLSVVQTPAVQQQAGQQAPEPAAAAPAAEEPPPAPALPAPKVVDPRAKANALAQVAALAYGPIDLDVYVKANDRNQLRQIRDSYEYARKVDELHPKFDRIQLLYARALLLWNADQDNAELTRMVGELALRKGDPESAELRFTQAADSGDARAKRMLGITSALSDDLDATAYWLLRYFEAVPPDDDAAAWSGLLSVLDARGGRGALAELLDANAGNEAASEEIRAAMGLAVPDATAVARPKPTPPNPLALVRLPTGSAAKAIKANRKELDRSAVAKSQKPYQKPYQHAKYLEHKEKNLEAAAAAYREAIHRNDKKESAVKDLAWIAKRLVGSEAALDVIEREFAGVVQPGNTLDNILIDFLPGAGRHEEALQALYRQHRRRDISESRRYHLAHQIAYEKLTAGQDAVTDWRQLLERTPDNAFLQRGLAMALIQRGDPASLDEAETLVETHTDDKADGIRRQITRLREGGELTPEEAADLQRMVLADAELPDPTPPLVTYVMQNFASFIQASAKEQGDRDTRTPTRDMSKVFADIGRQMAGKQPENSARAYISAASASKDSGDDPEKYLYRGLIALSGVLLGRQEYESARDLYCAGLAAGEESDDPEIDRELRSAVVGYLRLMSGRPLAVQRRRGDREPGYRRSFDLAEVLIEELYKHGREVHSLLLPLFASTSETRELVLEAICSKDSLRAASADYLSGIGVPLPLPDAQSVRTAWQHAVEQWSREQHQMAHGLTEPKDIAVSEKVLESALSRLDEFRYKAPQLQDALGQIREALAQLRTYINAPSYEERATCLRAAGSAAETLQADVARGPTSLNVELVYPVAERIQALVQQTQKDLDLDNSWAPQPELTLAREQSSATQQRVVTVQIKVSNARLRAPLDSPELRIDAVPELFTVDAPIIRLATTVRGGDHHIRPVKLQVTKRALTLGAFSMKVELRYRSRSTDEFVSYEAVLPVRLVGEGDFEPIDPNPFQEWATGIPVTNPNMFFGRDDLIDQIIKRLTDATEPGIGFAVFGQKRAGKSSIRLALYERLRAMGMAAGDLGNIGALTPKKDEDSTRLLARLMWRILTHADVALREVGAPPLIPDGMDRDRFIMSPEPVYDCVRALRAAPAGPAGADEAADDPDRRVPVHRPVAADGVAPPVVHAGVQGARRAQAVPPGDRRAVRCGQAG